MKKTKILVVEDELLVAEDLKYRLSSLGYQVVGVASSGKAAIAKAVELKPDLILMDIKLQGEMDGIEAAGKIKLHQNIPVIFLTAYSDDATLKRAKITEPFGFLIKPYEDRELQINIEVGLFRYQSEEKIKAINEQLKEINNHKDKMFSIISHDLRGPFHGLLGFIDILKEDIDSLSKAEIFEVVNKIDSSAKKVFMLLENLLQWSRIHNGKLEYKPGKINLNEITKHSISLLSSNVLVKNINILNNIGEELFAEADYNMLLSAIENILTNAIKFTPKDGKISIEASQINGAVKYSITDTGIGMSGEKVKSILNNEFLQSTKGTENESGTGLGLMICKELVETNGGELEITSEINKGTTVSIILPSKNSE